jgi:hypothetical protein
MSVIPIARIGCGCNCWDLRCVSVALLRHVSGGGAALLIPVKCECNPVLPLFVFSHGIRTEVVMPGVCRRPWHEGHMC